MRRRVFSFLYWAFIFVSSLLLFPVAVLVWVVTAPFDRRLVAQHRFTCFWASLYTWINPAWHVTIEGREHIRPGATYVMVANHQSLLDIMVLFRLFAHFKWVSKAELFRIPCVGWNMTLNRYIRLRRGDPDSIATMLRDAERTLVEGSSLMIFPEGTRSADGRLKPFKHGAFTLAHRARVPILPIVVEGTAHVLPKKGLVLQGQHAIRIRVLDEIPYASFADTSVEELTAQVHALFLREVGELPAPVAPAAAASR